MSALAAVLALAAAVAFGAMATRHRRGIERAVCAAVVSYVSLATVLSFVGGIGSLAHHGLLRAPTGPAVAAAVLAAAALVVRSLVRRAAAEPSRWVAPVRWEVAVVAVAVVALLVSVVGHAVHPPSGFDALSYHLPMATSLLHGGTLTAPVSFLHDQWRAGQPPGNFPLAYPGASEAVDGVVLVAAGEHAVWLLQTAAAVVVAGTVGALAVRLGGRPWLPVACVLVCPLVVFQAPSAYNDLVAVACLAVAVLLLTGERVTGGDLVIAGAALGGAAATKTVMLPVVVVLVLVAVVRGRNQRVFLLLAGMMVLAPGIAWWIRDAVLFDNPVFPVVVSLGPLHLRGLPSSTFGLAAQQRNFVPNPAAWPAYPLFEKFSDTSGYGAAFLVVAVPAALLAVVRTGPWRTTFVRLWLLIWVTSLVVAVAFPLPTPRFQLLPVLLTFAFCGLLPDLWPVHQRLVVGLAVAAVAVTAVVAVDRLRPQIDQPTDRARFLAAVDYVEPFATGFGDGERIWDDTSWSDYAFAAVYGLSGPDREQEVLVGSLDGLTPQLACQAMPPGVDHVYVVADEAVPVARVAATYASPYFAQVANVARKGPHGVQRRTLFAVSPDCAILARR